MSAVPIVLAETVVVQPSPLGDFWWSVISVVLLVVIVWLIAHLRPIRATIQLVEYTVGRTVFPFVWRFMPGDGRGFDLSWFLARPE